MSNNESMLDTLLYLADRADSTDLSSYSASKKFEIIISEFAKFESGLDDDQELAVALAYPNSTEPIRVIKIDYKDPDLLFLYGELNGHSVELIQHISQINLLLKPIKKQNPNASARRIGFAVPQDHQDHLIQ